MQVWEHKLHVRRRACEFRLFEKRSSHSRMTEYRNKFDVGTKARNDCDKYLAAKQREIVNVLDEIRFIMDLAKIGPVYANQAGISPEGSQKAISLFGLFDRVKENTYTDSGYDGANVKGIRQGLDIAMDILLNPRNYMTEEEQKAYDLLEKKDAEEDARAARYRQPVVPPTTGKRPTTKKPGRPKGSGKKQSAADYEPQVAVKLRIVDGQAKISI